MTHSALNRYNIDFAIAVITDLPSDCLERRLQELMFGVSRPLRSGLFGRWTFVTLPQITELIESLGVSQCSVSKSGYWTGPDSPAIQSRASHSVLA